MSITALLTPFARLFLLLALGALLGRLHVITAEGSGQLSALIINVTMPAVTLVAVARDLSLDMLRMAPWAMVLVVVVGLILWATAMLAGRAARLQPGTRGAAALACGCFNTASLGIPVVQTVLGPVAAVYAVLADMGTNINLFTFGVAGLANGRSGRWYRPILKALLSPMFMALFVGGGWFATGWELPPLVADALDLLAGCNAPLSMLLLGYLIYSRARTGLAFTWPLLGVVVTRLVASPLLMLALTAPLPLEPLTRATVILQAGMPAAMLSPVLAKEYDADVALAVTAAVVSTALAMLTLPGVAWLATRGL
ncbi:MAG: AEC family transporter [Anaerolineae bacterium]|jgi:predicted permease